METNWHSLSMLFSQLGLPSDEKSIAAFIKAHKLQAHDGLVDAPCWTPSQAAFLKEAFENDSDWIGVVDELASLLRQQ